VRVTRVTSCWATLDPSGGHAATGYNAALRGVKGGPRTRAASEAPVLLVAPTVKDE